MPSALSGALLLAACSGAPTPIFYTGPGTDAGPVSGNNDGGQPSDGGPTPDAGPVLDGGSVPDAGPNGAADAGPMGSDAGPMGPDGGMACTPASVVSCECSGGGTGTEMCLSDGSGYGACTGCSSSGCTPNDTQSCACTGGGTGAQLCSSSGVWGSCLGCPMACTPNTTQSCTCSGGGSGTQTCNSTGSGYGSCSCPEICTPNSTKICNCSGNELGVETCSSDGTAYSACTDCMTDPCAASTSCGTCNEFSSCGWCSTAGRCEAAGAHGSLTGSCTGSAWISLSQNCPGAVCIPGQTQTCTCSNGGRGGSQTCDNSAEFWSTCTGCGPPGCSSDSDCSGNPTQPICDTSTGQCVACQANADCGPGSLCQSNQCSLVSTCTDGSQCTSNTNFPACDTTQGICVQCLSSPGCGVGHRCHDESCQAAVTSGSLTCVGIVNCGAACSTPTCIDNCYLSGTLAAQNAYLQLDVCVAEACPQSGGGICDTTSSSYNATNCQNCINNAPEFSCPGQTSTCEST